MLPVLGVWLAVLGVLCAVASLLPPPRRPLRAQTTTIATLLCTGGAAGLLAIGLGTLGLWSAGAVGAMAACGVVLPCLWLVRAPDSERDDDDGSDDDGGQPRRPEPPAPSTPGGPLGTDWQSFDDLRAGWERPAREREPVAP